MLLCVHAVHDLAVHGACMPVDGQQLDAVCPCASDCCSAQAVADRAGSSNFFYEPCKMPKTTVCAPELCKALRKLGSAMAAAGSSEGSRWGSLMSEQEGNSMFLAMLDCSFEAMNCDTLPA